ncbi:MAG TPA: amidase [Burkholderiales bacterium]|nr:amidase [Burkholderiales bacterium]
MTRAPGEIAMLGAAALAARLRTGELGARALLELYLERIERLNGKVNAVVTLDAEQALARVDVLDRAEADGALAGLPVTIKDSLETAGLRTTCGAPQWAKHVPSRNADVVQLAVDAGAVVFGKTNVPIYTTDLQSYNTLFGTTSNPWDATRTAGGSSGGAAAAVACGFTAFELGSDIGGSIRTPAHFCGIYGHKPSYGTVPGRGHIPPPPGAVAVPDLSVIGPLARRADDLELLLGTIAAPDPLRADAWRLELPPARPADVAGYRVAVWLDDPAFPLDEQVRAVLESAVDRLAAAGARVVRAQTGISLEALFDDYLRLLWSVTTAHLSARALERLVEEGRAHAEDSWQRKLARYATLPQREWLAADERRQRLRLRLREFFAGCDVLLMPVNPVTAIAHDHSDDLMGRTIRVNGNSRWYWEQLAWIAPATMAYLPATVAPAGLAANGLPVGIQIVGDYLQDRTTIDFARRLADVVGGFTPPPGFD